MELPVKALEGQQNAVLTYTKCPRHTIGMQPGGIKKMAVGKGAVTAMTLVGESELPTIDIDTLQLCAEFKAHAPFPEELLESL